MAKIMIGPRLAVIAASLGIGLSGLSFSSPASAWPTCMAQMAAICSNGDWWRNHYASQAECAQEEYLANCMHEYESYGSEAAVRPSPAPDPA